MLKKKEESRVKKLLKAMRLLVKDSFVLDEEVAALAGLKPVQVKVLREVLGDLRLLFPSKPDSWIIRAAVRSFYVKEISKNHWVVKGLKELNDYYPEYHVTFDGSKYTCSCYTHMYGYTRKKKICGHVAAVMVFRRVLRRLKLK